jgi:hypothetical protein
VEIFGDKIHVKVDSAGDWPPRLRDILRGAGIEVDGLRAVPPSVEDIFLHLARESHGS